MLCQCGGYFKGEDRQSGNVFMRCTKCGDTQMICGACDAWMELVNGIFVCKCGNKERQ